MACLAGGFVFIGLLFVLLSKRGRMDTALQMQRFHLNRQRFPDIMKLLDQWE